MGISKNKSIQQDQKDHQNQQQKHQQQKTRQHQGSKKAAQAPVVKFHEQELPELRMFR